MDEFQDREGQDEEPDIDFIVISDGGVMVSMLPLPDAFDSIQIEGGHDGYVTIQLSYNEDGVKQIMVTSGGIPLLSWRYNG